MSQHFRISERRSFILLAVDECMRLEVGGLSLECQAEERVEGHFGRRSKVGKLM